MANTARHSPTPISPAPSSSSTNVGTMGTSTPTYVKNASAAAVTATNGFETRRVGGGIQTCWRRTAGIAAAGPTVRPISQPLAPPATAVERERRLRSSRRRCEPLHLDLDRQRLAAGRPDHDAAHGGHVPVVPSPRHRDVAVRRQVV